jgi:octaprenyl-diphosphate synthase
MVVENVQATPKPESYDNFLRETRKALEIELQRFMPQIKELRLYDKIEYVLRTEGKQLRSNLVILSGQSVGAKTEQLQRLCLAVELLHAATLVHDDILDYDVFRRNILSVQAKWGVKNAILVGDALAALSVGLVSVYDEQILAEMANACLLLSDGEYMDVELAYAGMSESDYFEKVKKKTASLFKAATKCGALAGKASPDVVECLAGFGENYGFAFQIRDDLLDVSSSVNGVPSDLNEFRATLPIIYLNQKSAKDAQAIIKKLMTSKRKNAKDNTFLFKELDSLLKKSGSVEYCNQKIDCFVQDAVSSLGPLKESIYKNYLKEMAESLKLQKTA